MIHLSNIAIMVINPFRFSRPLPQIACKVLINFLYFFLHCTGSAFTVLWENVKLQDKDDGAFTFSATLYDSGNITFAYYKIPMSIKAIQDDKHPVKVGLSDAYIIDKTIFCEYLCPLLMFQKFNLFHPFLCV